MMTSNKNKQTKPQNKKSWPITMHENTEEPFSGM